MSETAEAKGVVVALSERDAEFAVAHLRYVADREMPKDAAHAAANLSTRFIANEIESALRRWKREAGK